MNRKVYEEVIWGLKCSENESRSGKGYTIEGLFYTEMGEIVDVVTYSWKWSSREGRLVLQKRKGLPVGIAWAYKRITSRIQRG